ncbi:hypothetical protein D8674_034484 [Pyrus ussuriensis x Pyrus communis]|uniref:Uncharacterized protein n=1 Tax=Pyrus ussuriensis x Pyrus communis TaxID=2448454 RepID=A0A5N5HP35_9ROSA|nr:hypothetical protein D8674_034484 [Pyrus ussuriensis x Pyrus communis]
MWKVIKLVSKVFFLPDLAIADQGFQSISQSLLTQILRVGLFVDESMIFQELQRCCIIGFLCSTVWSILLSFSLEISASTALLLDQKLVAIQNPLTRMRIKSNLKPDSKELQVGNDNDNGEDDDDDTNPLFCT